MVSQLVAEYRAGSSTAEIMQQYGIGKGVALGILNQAGVIRRPRQATEEQMQEAARLYVQGWSLVRLGEHFDFEDSTIWLWFKKLGVPRRRPWERL